MQVHIQLFSILRDCLPPEARREGGMISLPDGATLADLIIHLNIDKRLHFSPHDIITRAAWQVRVNQEFEANAGRPLQQGDRVQIFPPIAGG